MAPQSTKEMIDYLTFEETTQQSWDTRMEALDGNRLGSLDNVVDVTSAGL